jgi:hypothetical protein
MSGIYLDILLCSLTYTILLWFIFWKKRNNRKGGSSDDDDGGIPVWNTPDLDLPPGVTLPGDGPTVKREEYEDALA